MSKILSLFLFLALIFLIYPNKILAADTIICRLDPSSLNITQKTIYDVQTRDRKTRVYDLNIYDSNTKTLYNSYGNQTFGRQDKRFTIGPFASGNYTVVLEEAGTGDKTCPIDFTVTDTNQPTPTPTPTPTPQPTTQPTNITSCYIPDLDNVGKLPNLPILYRGKAYQILLSNTLPDTQYSIKFDSTAYPLLPKTDSNGYLSIIFALEIHSGFRNGPHEVTFEPNISDNTQKLVNTCSLGAFGGGIKNNRVEVKSPPQLVDYGTCDLQTKLGVPDLPPKINNDNCKNGAIATIDSSTIIPGCVCKPSGPLPTGFYLDRQARTCSSCQLTDPKCQYTDITACNKALGDLNMNTLKPKSSPALSGGIPCDKNTNNPGIATAIGCIHTEPVELIKDLLKFVVAISGGLAFLMMLLGAFQMITSAGNPETLQAGRERFSSAIIGLLFVIFAVLLLQILGVGILAIPGFTK